MNSKVNLMCQVSFSIIYVCIDLAVYITDSIKVALGIDKLLGTEKLLFGGHSSKSSNCSVCPNTQWPITNDQYCQSNLN